MSRWLMKSASFVKSACILSATLRQKTVYTLLHDLKAVDLWGEIRGFCLELIIS